MGGRMSSQGQVTIPKAIREKLGLEPGYEVEFDTVADNVVLRKATSGIDWDRVYGLIDFGGRTTDEILAEIRPKAGDGP